MELRKIVVTGNLPYAIFGKNKAELSRIIFSSVGVGLEFVLSLDNEIRMDDVTDFEIVVGHYHLPSSTIGGYLIGDKGDYVIITWRVENENFIKLLKLMGFEGIVPPEEKAGLEGRFEMSHNEDKEILEAEELLKPKLTNDFLDTLVQAVNTCEWAVDFIESAQFVDWCFELAGKPLPPLDVYNEEENNRRKALLPERQGN